MSTLYALPKAATDLAAAARRQGFKVTVHQDKQNPEYVDVVITSEDNRVRAGAAWSPTVVSWHPYRKATRFSYAFVQDHGRYPTIRSIKDLRMWLGV